MRTWKTCFQLTLCNYDIHPQLNPSPPSRETKGDVFSYLSAWIQYFKELMTDLDPVFRLSACNAQAGRGDDFLRSRQNYSLGSRRKGFNRMNMSVNVDGFVKSPISALRYIVRHCNVLICTPHFSRFARLEPGTFYTAVINSTFYEFINMILVRKCVNNFGADVLPSITTCCPFKDTYFKI